MDTETLVAFFANNKWQKLRNRLAPRLAENVTNE